jgi:hypothetical protein
VDNTSDLSKPISTLTQAALDAKENLSNKSTTTTLGTSDDFYPTQNAVKTYVDGALLPKKYDLGLHKELGGVVFYIVDADASGKGEHGLVVATINQCTTCSWYEAQNDVSDQNKLEDNLITDLKKFTDWRLPTKNELILLYNKKSFVIAEGGKLSSDHYWSSTFIGMMSGVGISFTKQFTSGEDGGKVWSDSATTIAVRSF